jgi:hypothetical protein
VAHYFEERKSYLCLKTNVSGQYLNLRRINEVSDKFRTLHNEGAHCLCSSLTIFLISLTRRPQLVGHGRFGRQIIHTQTLMEILLGSVSLKYGERNERTRLRLGLRTDIVRTGSEMN